MKSPRGHDKYKSTILQLKIYFLKVHRYQYMYSLLFSYINIITLVLSFYKKNRIFLSIV